MHGFPYPQCYALWVDVALYQRTLVGSVEKRPQTFGENFQLYVDDGAVELRVLLHVVSVSSNMNDGGSKGQSTRGGRSQGLAA